MAATGNKRSVFVAAAIAAAVAAACGSSNPDLFPRNGSKGDAGSLGPGGGDDGGGTFTGVTDAGFSLDAFVACAATTEQAKELPLDLYLMLDTSGSMDDLVAAQKSKWNAVVSAMMSFFADPASAGIGVGLQYFPLTQAGIPMSCTSSAQCGAAAGPCFLKACAVSGTTVYPCDTPADCPGAAQCISIGLCQYDHNVICAPPGNCLADNNGFALGTCNAISTSTCVLGDSCAPQDYAIPAVPIALLPGAAGTLSASLAARAPNGNTPTAAALQGAIDEAKAYAAANPAHSVVAVLATDGIPDECNPNDIPSIARLAAMGLSGSPGVKTFVIGVFAPGDIASGTAALNQIAKSGGTNQAFVIDTTKQDVEQQFAAALSSIRGAALPCQYQLPVPEGGAADYGNVNVEYTSGAGIATGVPYVQTVTQCGPGSGWYYDVDPTQGTPNAILVCPGTCAAVQSDAKGRVDVVIGCRTIPR